MPRLVGIREVPAIPRDEKVASMKRGRCQVKGITLRIIRHDFVGDVCINYLGDGLIQVDERKISDQRQGRIAVRKISGSQFGVNSQARHQLIDACASGIKPPPCPVATCDHLRFRPHLVVEAGDGGFDVNAGHASILTSLPARRPVPGFDRDGPRGTDRRQKGGRCQTGCRRSAGQQAKRIIRATAGAQPASASPVSNEPVWSTIRPKIF